MGPTDRGPVPDDTPVTGSPADVADGLASGRYVDTIIAAEKLGVRPSRLHDWRRRHLVDVVRDGGGAAVLAPGRGGWRDVWVWADLDAVNATLIRSRRGRRRQAL